mmetsp:Transcript_333/g.1203  ORF Transcript_333/g.1203 Transcript_333/m.1203 type:complete len:109 (-) Transcript_333:2008-2334(-)
MMEELQWWWNYRQKSILPQNTKRVQLTAGEVPQNSVHTLETSFQEGRHSLLRSFHMCPFQDQEYPERSSFTLQLTQRLGVCKQASRLIMSRVFLFRILVVHLHVPLEV